MSCHTVAGPGPAWEIMQGDDAPECFLRTTTGSGDAPVLGIALMFELLLLRILPPPSRHGHGGDGDVLRDVPPSDGGRAGF